MDNVEKEQMNKEFKEAVRQDKIRTAEKELAEFIEKSPQYKKQQEDIQKILDATPEDTRIEVIALLMSGKVAELANALNEINKIAMKLC